MPARELLGLAAVLVVVRAVAYAAAVGVLGRDSGDPVTGLTHKLMAVAVFLPFVQALYASKVADDAALSKWGRVAFVAAFFVVALPVPYELALMSV